MKHKNKQTKFPVARIKKIMQKDEEVGKVAQATPVVISKALELFLGLIVDEASKVTMERGSKKVEAYHLKHAVETTEILDFLKEIVEGVADPSAGGTIDLESESAEAKKKRGKGKKTAVAGDGPVKKRRKKKDGQEAEGEGDVEMRSEPEPDQDEEEEEEPKPKKPRKRPAKNPKPKSSSNGKEDEWQEDKPFMPRS
ncbi:histone-fold-containing protein [Collybia nuda]|uniref:Histone-fold-containing protein n=1 Tax=Collybia nuda TaxID=64659 RepID=A0A9P6CMU1_9AGAR|nr:histone-fold-containing protein [Collybia nuda]